MDRSFARLRYEQHRRNAEKRGVLWELTFEEWCVIWAPHWHERGPHQDEKVMCRTHDQGAYRADNVRIDSPKGNAAERGLMQKCGRTYWRASQDQGGAVVGDGFKSYGSHFERPDRALERQQQEYEWIPGE